MDNSVDVGGFQFAVTGVEITGATGGSAASNGFMVSTSTTMVLGFSLTGSSIPPGSEMLVNVEFENFQGGEICVDSVILSDTSGGSIDVNVGECFELSSGCTDPSACNYDENADVSDGSCYYEDTLYCYLDSDGDGYWEDEVVVAEC